ncbi:hypothetical protein MJD09_12330 [bacterium]|nr:hypothetical protein [bacterium]
MRNVDIEEYVVENGSISNETIQIDFNGFQNIMIIPPKSYVVQNLITDPDYNWLVFGGYWGHRFTTPTGTFLGIAIGNEAALGPYGGIVASNEIRF